MGLGKHQGSHCRDYNTHISTWQPSFQRMTSRQDPVQGGIQWHFLSPLQTLIAYTVTVFTTSCQFMRIRCLQILSQRLWIGLRFFTHYHTWCLACGHLQRVTTQTEKDSREVLWSHVLSERLLLIVHDSISLSPLDGAMWHTWRHAAGHIVPRRLGVTLNNVKL